MNGRERIIIMMHIWAQNEKYFARLIATQPAAAAATTTAAAELVMMRLLQDNRIHCRHVQNTSCWRDSSINYEFQDPNLDGNILAGPRWTMFAAYPLLSRMMAMTTKRVQLSRQVISYRGSKKGRA